MKDEKIAIARLRTWVRSTSEVSVFIVALSCIGHVVVIWSNYCDTGVPLNISESGLRIIMMYK